MFIHSLPRAGWRPRPAWLVSIAAHGLLVTALLHGRSPIFVAPSSVLGGANGTSITHLYWATGTDTEANSPSKASGKRTASRTRLTWKKSGESEFASHGDMPRPEIEDTHEIASAAANPAPSAGTAYGSLSDGAAGGHEIRAALPAVTFEPAVAPEDLRGATEGNVVIEITIDEAGNIVSKMVVQSLGPAIDAKVLAALENWRFRPATRDGVPIPSKQDVVYHFKPR
jgi:TonB family protein